MSGPGKERFEAMLAVASVALPEGRAHSYESRFQHAARLRFDDFILALHDVAEEAFPADGGE